MMELGRIPIRHQTAVGEARRKLRIVTEELTRDPILATRVATAVSEMTRTLLRRGDQPHIRVSLESNGDQATLVLSFADRQPLPSMDFIQTLVDSVDPSSSDGQKGYVARAFCALPVPLSVDAAKIDHLRTIVEEKSRNRLMSDLQIKNRELQESFESLKRTTSAKERMESELNIGQEIQMSMLPRRFSCFSQSTRV